MRSDVIRNTLVIRLKGESPMNYSQIKHDAQNSQLAELGFAFISLLRTEATDLSREVRTHLFRP